MVAQNRPEEKHYLFYQVPCSIPYICYRCKFHPKLHPKIFNVLSSSPTFLPKDPYVLFASPIFSSAHCCPSPLLPGFYTHLYPVVSTVPLLPWAFEQALPFTANHFPFYWSYLLLNLQFSGWAWQPSLWRKTLPTSFQNSKYCSLSKPYPIASYLLIDQPSTISLQLYKP